MDADAFQALTKVYPSLLQGAKVSRDPLPPATTHQPPFICGAFSPDGNYLALSGGGRIPSRPAIWIAKVPSFETAMVLRGHQGVHSLAWDPETWLLASASNDYTTVLWDIQQGDHLFVIGGNHEPIVKGVVAFGSDALYIGETEAFGDRRSRLLRVGVSTASLETLLTLDRGMSVQYIAVDPATNDWACVSDDFHYSGKPTLHRPNAEPEGIAPVGGIYFCDGALVRIPAGDDAAEDIFRANGRTVTNGTWSTELDAPADYVPTLLVVSPDRKTLAVAGFGHVALLDARLGTVVAQTAPPAWFTGIGKKS